MATADSVKAKMQGLIDSANAKTGGNDTTLTAAVNALIAGFGSGGGGSGSDVSLADVDAFVADFSDKTSYTILNGAYHGTKRAIVS